MKKNTKIYIAGHKGMVGSAIWRLLEQNGYKNLIGRTSKELDLKNQTDVQTFFNTQKKISIKNIFFFYKKINLGIDL